MGFTIKTQITIITKHTITLSIKIYCNIFYKNIILGPVDRYCTKRHKKDIEGMNHSAGHESLDRVTW